jgi:hypothetical protein
MLGIFSQTNESLRQVDAQAAAKLGQEFADAAALAAGASDLELCGLLGGAEHGFRLPR